MRKTGLLIEIKWIQRGWEKNNNERIRSQGKKLTMEEKRGQDDANEVDTL